MPPPGPAAIDFVATGRQTRKLLAAAGIAKSLGGRPLFSGLELTLSPGNKLGLLGPNGSGKSTLLRVLARRAASRRWHGHAGRRPTHRHVRAGPSNPRPSGDAATGVCPNGDTVLIAGRPRHHVALAKQFLFRPEQLEVTVGSLSGGEQARLALAQLMLQPADLLLLDEPTNDLDISALEVLEDSLEEFAGALVLVSHDRELMDRLCTEVVGLDGRGGSAVYASVEQWLAAYERAAEEAAKPAALPARAELPLRRRRSRASSATANSRSWRGWRVRSSPLSRPLPNERRTLSGRRRSATSPSPRRAGHWTWRRRR